MLKKQWRAEWESERALAAPHAKRATLESLNAKIAAVHQRRLQAMSPRTRAAWDAFTALEAEDKATGYQWWTDPHHPANADQPEAEEEEWEVPKPSPEMQKLLPNHAPREADDGWEIIGETGGAADES